MAVLFAIMEGSDLTDEDAVIASSIVQFVADLILLGASGLLIFGGIQLFRRSRQGGLFTWIGGAAGVIGTLVDFIASAIWLMLFTSRSKYMQHHSTTFGDFLDMTRDISWWMLLATLVVLILGLVPALKRGLR